MYDLTQWSRLTYKSVINLTTIGSYSGLSPGRGQAIIWTNAGMLLIGHLGINFSEILVEIHAFSFKKLYFELSSKWKPFCLGLNVLRRTNIVSTSRHRKPDRQTCRELGRACVREREFYSPNKTHLLVEMLTKCMARACMTIYMCI